MKKKFAAILLCAAVCLTAGCGSKNEPISTPNISDTARVPGISNTSRVPGISNTSSTPNTSDTSSAPDTSNTSSAPNTSDTSSAPDTSDTSNAPDTSAPTGFERGKWNGNVFTSDFFGLSLTLDDECTKFDDSELALMNGIADMSDANFISAVENSDQNKILYEVFAQYREGASIALAYNRYEDMSLDEYLEANKLGLGYSGVFNHIRIDTVNIGGKKQPCIYADLGSGAFEIKEIMVIYKTGDYFAIATLGALSTSELRNMIREVLG